MKSFIVTEGQEKPVSKPLVYSVPSFLASHPFELLAIPLTYDWKITNISNHLGELQINHLHPSTLPELKDIKLIIMIKSNFSFLRNLPNLLDEGIEEQGKTIKYYIFLRR